MGAQAGQVAFLGKSGEDMDGLAEIVAELASLDDVVLQGLVLLCLHLEKAGALDELGVLQDLIRDAAEDHVQKQKQNQYNALKYQERGEHPARMKDGIGVRDHQQIKDKQNDMHREKRRPHRGVRKLIDELPVAPPAGDGQSTA